MREKSKSMIAYVLLILFGAVYLIQTFSIKKVNINTIADSFLPRVACICMMLLCAYQMAKGLIKQAKTRESTALSKEKWQVVLTRLKKIGVLLVVLAVAVALLKSLGFVIDMALLLFVLFFLFTPKEKRTKKQLILYGISSPLISLFVYYVFLKVFSVLLPAGILKMLG